MNRTKLFFSVCASVLFLLAANISFAQDYPVDPRIVPAPPFTVGKPLPLMMLPPADTITGHWSTLTNYFLAVYGPMLYNYPDSNGVWCAGGTDGATFYPNFYLYNLTTNAYQTRQSMPTGRALNKMVKARGKFYVTSAVLNFTTPDGATYEYTPGTGWATKTAMNAPIVHESGIFVYNDSLIFCVGGATSGFGGFVTTVRYFNPFNNTWTTCPTAFPIPIDLTQGECIGNQVVMFAGYNGAGVNTIYRGTVVPGATMDVQWRSAGNMPPNPTGGAPYRECTGILNNQYILFGPAQSIAGGVEGQTWGFNMVDSTLRRFLPDMPVPVGNIHGIAVKTDVTDSVRFYYLGGYTAGATSSNLLQKFAYGAPLPAPPCEQFTSATFPPTSPAAWTITSTGTIYWTRQTPSGFGVGTGSARYDMWNGPAGTNQSLNTYTSLTIPGSPGGIIVDMAYQPYPATQPYAQDSLVILASTNGGTTYTSVARLGPLQLQTTVAGATTEYTTPANSEWKKRFYVLPAGTNKVSFLGESQFGNHLYLDSICSGDLTAITHNGNILPGTYSLSQNYPNPFNPTTVITYGLPKSGNVKMVVYDILGREVRTLVNEFKKAGAYNINFDASSLSSGVYFYKIVSGDFSETKKMLLVK